ncbi:MAG TPA: outer membrane beta-barrel protein [Longimicrobiales bacterium]
MKTFSRGLWLVPIFAALMTVPASAQRWTWDFGVYGGYSWYSKLLDSDETGLPDDAAAQTFKWESGFMGGIQIGYNFGSNLGVRLNTRYTDRPIVGSDMEDFEFVSSTNLWAASLDLLYRFKNAPDEFLGTEIYPYVALGLGAKWMNPGGDQFTCNDTAEGESFACVPFTSGGPQGSVNSRTFAIGEKNSLMGLIGLGADWRLSRSFILRTEINDQIYSPQVYRINQPWTGTTVTLTNEDNRANLINEIGLTLGLHFLFGIAPVPVVAVAPPPPPPPPPVAPPPPPPPREDAITICVVDPTAPGGLRMQSATLVESRDTFIVVGGTRTPISSANLGSGVTVATGSDWYVRGQPLVMTVGRSRVEFATYGGAQRIASQDLAYLGTVNGFPVYADRDDVSSFITELDQLNRSRPNTDLGVLLNDQRTLRTSLENVRMWYVPVYPYGCVFQGVQRAEPVTKGK